MTALAVGKTHKAEMQVQLAADVVGTNEPLGSTHIVPFEEVREALELSRAPKRPNRNRPIHSATPTLQELLELAANNPPPPEFFEGDEECPW